MVNGFNNKSKKEFFAAANSGNGFVSFYSQIFGNDRIEQRYLIKGGPGTGKSTFMKKIAQRAEEKGIGLGFVLGFCGNVTRKSFGNQTIAKTNIDALYAISALS